LEIQKKMKTNISSKMTKIKNVDELWLLMANEIWTKYLKTIDDITISLKKYDKDTIVIFFSAWNLDYIIRNNLEYKAVN
jgi:hypothetical protein